MKQILGVALGILTAIGGFLDIGDLVTNAVVGSRFGLSLAWVVVVGVIGICVFAQMSGRVAAVSGRATFELIRERLGPRVAVLNLGASFMINLMTLTAEIGGVALALQLVSSVSYLLWVPFAALAVWLVIWRVKFSVMEKCRRPRRALSDRFCGGTLPASPRLGRAGTASRSSHVDCD